MTGSVLLTERATDAPTGLLPIASQILHHTVTVLRTLYTVSEYQKIDHNVTVLKRQETKDNVTVLSV